MKSQTQDGRVQRAEKGRQRVSEALLALVVKTGQMPSVEEVAVRAGVARRSVFRYFDGVEALELETARAMRSLMTQQVPAPDATGPLAARLEALVRHRERLYERITPVRRFLEAARQRGNTRFDALIDEARRLLAAQLSASLQPELARAPGLQPALEVMTSWEAWVALREGQRRSPTSARRIVTEALETLLLGAKATTRAPAARARSAR